MLMFFQSRILASKSRLHLELQLEIHRSLAQFTRANISKVDNFFTESSSPTRCWRALSDDFTSHYKSFSDSIKNHRSLLQLLNTLTRNLYFSSVELNENLVSRLFRQEPLPQVHRRQLHLLKFNNDFSCSSSVANARTGIEGFKSRSGIMRKKFGVCNVFLSTKHSRKINILKN